MTIYTYLKEIERDVNGKRTVENLTYKVYDFGGKRKSDISNVNIRIAKVEDSLAKYECVPTKGILKPTVNEEGLESNTG